MTFMKAYLVAFVSMISGAAVVHNICKPDLVSGKSDFLPYYAVTIASHSWTQSTDATKRSKQQHCGNPDRQVGLVRSLNRLLKPKV